jgi:hypothetical protein
MSGYRNRQMADAVFGIPEDKRIAEHIRLGRRMAKQITAPAWGARLLCRHLRPSIDGQHPVRFN